MLYAYYVCCINSNALQSTFTMESNTMNPDQTASKELTDLDQYCLQYRPPKYCKISITGPCSNRAPFPKLDDKNAYFSSKFPPKNEPLIKARPRILKKNMVLRYAKFVISSEFLVVPLQRIVPKNKVHCFFTPLSFCPPSLARC